MWRLQRFSICRHVLPGALPRPLVLIGTLAKQLDESSMLMPSEAVSSNFVLLV